MKEKDMNKEKNQSISEIIEKIINIYQNKQTRMKFNKFRKLSIQHIHEAWDKIEPRLKTAFHKLMPDIENIAKELEENLKQTSSEIEPDLNDILKAIFSIIEQYFDNFKSESLNFLKNHPEPKILLEFLKEQSPIIEKSISQDWKINDYQSDFIIKEIKKTEKKVQLLHSGHTGFSIEELVKFSNSEDFKRDIQDNYTITGLNSDRIKLITEAIVLHHSEYFAGSVTLLYSQIEGIITDALIEKEYAEVKNNKVFIKNKKKKTLPGLSTKIEHAGQQFHELEDFFNELLKGKIVVEQTISKSRNAVLHGNDVHFANQTQSLSLILCLYSLIMKVRLLFER